MLKKIWTVNNFWSPYPTWHRKTACNGFLNFTRRHDVICLKTTYIDMTMQALRVAKTNLIEYILVMLIMEVVLSLEEADLQIRILECQWQKNNSEILSRAHPFSMKRHSCNLCTFFFFRIPNGFLTSAGITSGFT